MEQRQVNQGYREALFQISPTVEKKREKGNRGHWRELSVKKRGKKRKRVVGKENEMTETEILFH